VEGCGRTTDGGREGAFSDVELVDVLTGAVARSDGWFVQEVPLVVPHSSWARSGCVP
jgi:hypothetical protein